MRGRLIAVAMLAWTGVAGAHRLDEYLQGTIFSIAKDRVRAEMTLTPGVAVLPAVLQAIGTNPQTYADRVLLDLSLKIDGQTVRLRLISVRFPTMAEMQDGRGEIEIAFEGDVPRGGGSRTLVFENHHQNAIAAYQVNCLVPADRDIRIVKQDRNYTQSIYRLSYVQGGGGSWTAAKWGAMLGVVGLAWAMLFWRRT